MPEIFNEFLKYVKNERYDIDKKYHDEITAFHTKILNKAKKFSFKDISSLCVVDDALINIYYDKYSKISQYDDLKHGLPITISTNEYKLILEPKQLEFYLPNFMLANSFSGKQVELLYDKTFSIISDAVNKRLDNLPF